LGPTGQVLGDDRNVSVPGEVSVKLSLVSAFSIAGLVLVAGAAQADDVRVIVGFKGDASAALVKEHGGRVHGASDGWVSASLAPGQIAKLRASADVAYVEEDSVMETLGRENAGGKPGGGGSTPPPAESTPWGVTRVDADDAWAAGKTGEGIKVMVIDTGVDQTHPDLLANIKGGKDFVNGDSNPDDDNGHGSHVAGTIAAVDNTIGVIGVAPGADLYAAKVLNRRGSGWLSDVAFGIDYARTTGMHVANMSLGASSGASTLETACDAAAAAGVLLCAAAGNSGDGNETDTELGYPAAYASCVAVGATDSSDEVASFSNSGDFVDFSAPGVSIPSTFKDGQYTTYSGTSMATPHVAGMAALLWSDTPTADGVRDALESNVRDLGPDGDDFGYGIGLIDWTPVAP
jgi:subtilisin